MKLTIFGATGKVGRHLVSQAIEQGHEVSAFSRSPNQFDGSMQNLTLIKGDVLDKQAVKNAVIGQDAVICALGMPLMNKDGLRARGTGNIVDAMQELGVERLVCLSIFGAGSSWNMLPWHYRKLIMPTVLRRALVDHQNQENHLNASKLDWVAIRPGNFTDGKRTGSYWHGLVSAGRSLTLKISQADVADFMLKQLKDNTYLRQSPCISY